MTHGTIVQPLPCGCTVTCEAPGNEPMGTLKYPWTVKQCLTHKSLVPVGSQFPSSTGFTITNRCPSCVEGFVSEGPNHTCTRCNGKGTLDQLWVCRCGALASFACTCTP